MKLFVTRHGETPMNAARVVCGRTDIDLTEKGVEQAIEAGKRLIGKGICRIIASPMIRAQHTARLIAEQIGVDPAAIETDLRLIEQDYGIYENTDWDGGAFNANRSQLAVRCPGGESKMDMAGRLYPLLNELKAQGGEPALLVCHGAVCRVIHTYFYDMDNDAFAAFRLPNCATTEYEL